jgi:uncharacterized protein
MTENEVREIFRGLEHEDGAAFFTHVADDVDWVVMGTHPLAGHYRSKAAFRAGTFDKLECVLQDGAQLTVDHVLISGDESAVELRSNASGHNGMRFDNRYCWIVKFEKGVVVSVRAYLDSALVARLFQENPLTRGPIVAQ